MDEVVTYDDEALAAAYAAKKQKQMAEDFAKPFDPECILEVRHLRKCFPLQKTITGKVTKELVAVDDVSFKLKAGETLGIVGESGCGKTTAGRAILKLHQPTGGQIIFNGEDITNYTPKQMRELRKQMQIIFQDPYSSLPPRDTVGGILSEPVKVHKIVPANDTKA
jgi:ABC-type microcin C transport system duplicated ATPase subunit YejF